MELIITIVIGLFILFFILKLLLGIFVPIEITARKLFDKTLLNKGIDWRCLKPEVKKEISILCIKIAELKDPNKGVKFKSDVVEQIENSSTVIAEYIITGDRNCKGPIIDIFNKYHDVNEFHRVK